MSVEGSVTHWIAELKLGQPDLAQEEIWHRYFRRLMGLARLKLGQTPKTTADEEDVAICALNSFYTGVAEGRFPELHDRTSLWPLLAKLTARKAIDQRRQVMAKKRGVDANVDLNSPESSSQLNWTEEISSDELDPEELLSIAEECDRLLSLLPEDRLKQTARKRLAGYSNGEIAKELGVVERTIERRLELIRAYWKADIDESS